jgi:hypothetical protein
MNSEFRFKDVVVGEVSIGCAATQPLSSPLTAPTFPLKPNFNANLHIFYMHITSFHSIFNLAVDFVADGVRSFSSPTEYT